MKGFKNIISLTGILAVLAACNGDDKPRHQGNDPIIANSSRSFIASPNGGSQVSVGTKVKLELSLRNPATETDSVYFFVDQQLVYSTAGKNNAYSFELSTDSLSLGKKSMKTVLVSSKGEREEQVSHFYLISDIEPAQYTYQVINTYPHDPEAYTQGLIIDNGTMYEGTGLEGKSELRIVDRYTGKIQKQLKLDNQYFGEGITILGDKLYQLTYRSKKGFVYNKKTFEKTGEFNYDTEGWGLTTDGKSIIYSDGSNKLYFLNPESLEKTKTIEVYNNKGPQNLINELEYINGEIWANIYQTNTVVRIDPSNGKIIGEISFTDILKAEDMHPRIDVLNGIAFDPSNGKIYVTGKNYPKLWEVKIVKTEI